MKKTVCFALACLIAVPTIAVAKKKHGIGSSFDDVSVGETLNDNSNKKNEPQIEIIRGEPDAEPAHQEKRGKVENKKIVPQERARAVSPQPTKAPQESKQAGTDNDAPFWTALGSALIDCNDKVCCLGVGVESGIANENLAIRAVSDRSISACGAAVSGRQVAITRGVKAKDDGTIAYEKRSSVFSQYTSTGMEIIDNWTNGHDFYALAKGVVDFPSLPLIEFHRKAKSETGTPVPDMCELNFQKLPKKSPSWLTTSAYGHTTEQGEDVLYAIGFAKSGSSLSMQQSVAINNLTEKLCLGYAKEQYPEDNAKLNNNTITYNCTFRGTLITKRWVDNKGNLYIYGVQPIYKVLKAIQ